MRRLRCLISHPEELDPCGTGSSDFLVVASISFSLSFDKHILNAILLSVICLDVAHL
jgi:hypothetical protein